MQGMLAVQLRGPSLVDTEHPHRKQASESTTLSEKSIQKKKGGGGEGEGRVMHHSEIFVREGAFQPRRRAPFRLPPRRESEIKKEPIGRPGALAKLFHGKKNETEHVERAYPRRRKILKGSGGIGEENGPGNT